MKDQKITINSTHPKNLTFTKNQNQNLKVYLLNTFMNYAAAWTSVVSASPLVLTYTSPITLPTFSANLLSSSVVKSLLSCGSTISDPQGILHVDDDFDFPVVTRTQQWKIGSNGLFWGNGGTGEISLGKDCTIFTVEQSHINNQVVFSDGKGCYVRAAKTLPYVILEWGATKSQATSFVVTWVTQKTMILSSTGSQSSTKRCHKPTRRTWVSHSQYVYLSDKQPSNSTQDPEAVLTVCRK